MKNLALTLISLAALTAPNALAQDWNRSIDRIVVRHDPATAVGTYTVDGHVTILKGPNTPPTMDLSIEAELYVNGILRTQTTTDVIAISDMPCASQDCGPAFCGAINPGPHQTDMFCQRGFGICYCGVNIELEYPDLELVTGDSIDIVIGAKPGAVQELYFDDDSLHLDFVGANYCAATPNSSGASATVTPTGSASIAANDLVLRAGPVPANVAGIFFYGTGPQELPFGDGVRCVGGSIFRFGVGFADSMGVLSRPVDYTTPPNQNGRITAGSTWRFQAWFRDPMGGPVGFNLSDGYVVTFLP